MAAEVRMPRWGMIMEEGTLLAWRKREGQEVAQGEAIAEIESDKAVQEIESPAAGVLVRLLVAEGSTVPVGSVIAVISEAGDTAEAVDRLLQVPASAPADEEAAHAGPANAPEAPSALPAARAASPAAEQQAPRISPAAKQLAIQEGIDWQKIPGSGPGGRIQISDVQCAVSAGVPRGLSTLRQAIARRTTLSIQAPQAALCREIDVTALLALRAGGPVLSGGARATLTAYLVQGIVRALRAVPLLNGQLLPAGHVMAPAVNMGLVVSTEGGIVVPVIRNVQDRSLEDINATLADFVRRAQEKTLRPEELQGGTFTVSNAGPLGIDIFQPLLNPPEVAVLGIGRIRQRPAVVEGRIEVRSMAYFCLGTDHRVVDAGPAGDFLRALDDILNARDAQA